jgi:tetrahydromethanopterin S-methyltransferase subunit A
MVREGSTVTEERINWPVVSGDYVVGDGQSPVAVLIIGRGTVDVSGHSVAIMGTVKTENMGLEKVITNIIANPQIRFVIVCGREEFGHFPADAIISLVKNGVDAQMRIIGSRSAIPFLCNIPPSAVERFRKQIELVDLVHPKEVREIVAYDPEYRLGEDRKMELEKAIDECHSRNPGRFPEEPFLIDNKGLVADGSKIAAQLNKLADDFVGQMLRMPSERLSTSASIAVVSSEFRVIFDPIDGVIRTVPSVEFAGRLQNYLRGVQ